MDIEAKGPQLIWVKWRMAEISSKPKHLASGKWAFLPAAGHASPGSAAPGHWDVGSWAMGIEKGLGLAHLTTAVHQGPIAASTTSAGMGAHLIAAMGSRNSVGRDAGHSCGSRDHAAGRG